MQRRCLCRCHCPPDAFSRADGVAVNDVLEAAASCSLCRNLHTAVFARIKQERAKTAWVDAPVIDTPPSNHPDKQWRP